MQICKSDGLAQVRVSAHLALEQSACWEWDEQDLYVNSDSNGLAWAAVCSLKRAISEQQARSRVGKVIVYAHKSQGSPELSMSLSSEILQISIIFCNKQEQRILNSENATLYLYTLSQIIYQFKTCSFSIFFLRDLTVHIRQNDYIENKWKLNDWKKKKT